MRQYFCWGLIVLALSGACHREHGKDKEAPIVRPQDHHIAEPIYMHGLAENWSDYGWAPRELQRGAPAAFDLKNHGGWILARQSLSGTFSGLSFKYWAPKDFRDFLEVRVDSTREDIFPRVRITDAYRAPLADGGYDVFVPMAKLNPEGLSFDRLIFRAAGSAEGGRVRIDEVGFTQPLAQVAEEKKSAHHKPPKTALMAIDCLSPTQKISPYIFGIAFDARKDHKDTYLWELGPTIRRWGGNTSSRYNWQLGNAWNTASDWFFRNVNFTPDEHYSYEKFFDDNIQHRAASALSVPIIGWVAKDTKSHAFSIESFGAQKAHDPNVADAGNGQRKDGSPIVPGPPTLTSVPAPPGMIGRWVQAIRERDKAQGVRNVAQYILDNEPMLWNSTHRDVHPYPTSYDELLERTIAYGSAVRRADPDAVIAGPAEWGWPAYHFSAVDAAMGFAQKPDRKAHDDMPLLPWYLKKLHEHEKKTGERVLDVVDVHYYPMAKGVGGKDGGTDAATAALRLRATRSLWDPSYVDESWINDAIRLIPRLKEYIAQNYPGRGISIGEYNFGAETHMSGGLALAEALGRFAQLGVTSAYYWTYPPKNSPAFYAFRAFRNFDGKGGHFLQNYVASRAPFGSSLFASLDDTEQRIVAVALNLDPEQPLNAQLDVGMCGKVQERKTYTYTGDAGGFVENPLHRGDGPVLTEQLPPYSITVFDIRFGSRDRSKPVAHAE